MDKNQLKAKREAIKEGLDAHYKAAIEKGDTETAQRMVDEVAKKDGREVEAPGDISAPEKTEQKKPYSERLESKLQNSKTELENLKKQKESSRESFDKKIEKLQAEYDSKKNKDTKVVTNQY